MPAAPRVQVQIDEPFTDAVPEALVRQAAEEALAREDAAGSGRVSIVVTDDETLQQLNRDFMGSDEVTDVLAFPAHETPGDDQPQAEGFPTSADEPDSLGDIAISCPQATRQAQVAGRPLERELALLAVHGVLHLLGYDHADPEQEAVMFGKTDAVLAGIFGREQRSQSAVTG